MQVKIVKEITIKVTYISDGEFNDDEQYVPTNEELQFAFVNELSNNKDIAGDFSSYTVTTKSLPRG